MKETVSLVSLGCPKNLVDSEVIAGLLAKAGYSIVPSPSKAQVIIVNTCSFIQDATEEAIDTILQLARYKERGRCRLLVVAGCLPQRYGRSLEREFPEVDLFIGTGDFQNLPEILSGNQKERIFLSKPSFLYDEETPRILSTPPFYAYLKIAEGCSNRCTFCTVPKIRGPYRSREMRSILTEARQLVDQGVREIILVAQDTTAYGRDLRNGSNLERLLEGLCGVEKLRWIRILYSYPRPDFFTEGLLKLLAREEKICPYLDLPIQHIDDEILKRMGRRSTRKDIYDLLEKIRAAVPEISLRTSVIVGFPGEKERHFRALLDFVEEAQFDHLGAFTYSAEEGTPASKLRGRIPQPVKEERLGILMALQRKISLKKHRTMVGRRVEVLVEKKDRRRNLWVGRLKTQAPEIDGSVLLRGNAKEGTWLEARITKALPYDLIGEIESLLP